MDISVLISTYRRSNILEKTLESFLNLNSSQIKFEILIVDNANDSNTKYVLKHYTSRLPLKFFVMKERGKNRALNFLLNYAKGKLIVFTDDDITPCKNWLIELWNAFRRWPDDYVFGGKVIPVFPPNTASWIKDPSFEYAAAAFAWFDLGDEEKFIEDSPVGPNMAVKSDIFFKYGFRFNENIGPNGSDYPMGSETSFYRIIKPLVKRCIYVPSAVVYHRIRPDQVTFNSLLKRAYRHGRGYAAIHSDHGCREFLGAPRYLYRKAFVLFLKYLLNCWRHDDIKWSYGKWLYFTLGMIKQYRTQS